MTRTRCCQAEMMVGGTRQNVPSWAGNWLRAALIALGVAGLVGCSSPPKPPPVPVYYSSEPVPNPPRHVPRPASASPVSANPASTPAESAPEGQLPPGAQSPAILPPPGGLPHDASEYVEPPSR